MPLPRGLYELILTEALATSLNTHDDTLRSDTAVLRSADAADRIALHISRIVERALEKVPDDDRVDVGVALSKELIARTSQDLGIDAIAAERPIDKSVLRSIRRRLPDRTFESITAPLIPLLDTALLTNAPGEPGVGHQIKAEIASADRIDLIMAFIRRSGMLPIREELRRHTQDGKNFEFSQLYIQDRPNSKL